MTIQVKNNYYFDICNIHTCVCVYSHHKIARYGAYELFGEEDILNTQPRRTLSGVCDSAAGECIMILKRDFFIRILREDTAKSYLLARLHNKNMWMEKKIANIRT